MNEVMAKESIENVIKAVTKSAFEQIGKVYQSRQEGKNMCYDSNIKTRLIFPHYSTIPRKENEEIKIRVSEQELKFIFIEEFNRYCDKNKRKDLFYSVETPTEYKYSFGDKKNPCRDDEHGQSAMVDLSIHDKDLKRVALIEFKALNPEEFCFHKDFVKLTEESKDNDLLTFFIMMVEGSQQKTLNSIHEKILTKDSNTNFICYCLKKQDVIIEDPRPTKIQ